MNLHKTLATVSGMTMVSRVTGLIREILYARAFGADGYTDAFAIAFRIPNLLRRLFAEGAFSQAFVPILGEYKNQKGEAATKELVDHVATVLTWAMLFTCIIGILATPVLVYFIATGLKDNKEVFDASVFMTRIMFPYIGFMSFVALAGGILNTWHEFKIPAFTSVLLNLAFIVASLFVAPYLEHPIYAMAFAVLVGGVLQVALQVPALIKVGMLPRIALNPMIGLRDLGVQRVLKKMGPAVFAVSAAQLSLLINTNIASRLGHGSVSLLTYGDRLMEFPTALLGVALGTILLPSLSKANADKDHREYSSLLDWGLRLTFLLALPSAVGLATLAVPLTATLFQHGKFDAASVAVTSQVLIAYGVGLIGLIVVKILAPGFYAKQDIRTPVKIAIGVLIATQLMNYVFVPIFAVAGLALSISVGACLNAGFLLWSLMRRGIYKPEAGWIRYFMRLLGALFLMAAVALWCSQQFDWTGPHTSSLARIAALCAVLAACGITYFGALLAMGFRFGDFKRIAR
ncbi:putative peptidoglycan lipid II flippase [Collimonas sp. OK307]|uniref:murein biosynthesis integral membrane protein MurJ n=1 Tax=Collimonas sp. OK307 TaxID=1801620 RepID=UPI0008F070BF|nr:murein biosynthesis integral membrane protein MurJ [Collimonas sp. OK307]SFI28890.1 putative peptidoglycan lipid II flippase [Collimonas sp. OK307]